MLKLVDLIHLTGVRLRKFKIHCATGKDPTPLQAFFEGSFKEWQEHQNNENFKCDRILSLISYQKDKWLFAGAFDVMGVVPIQSKGKRQYKYSTQEVEGLEELTGRAIIQFKKTFRASYLRGPKYIDQL